MHSPAPQRWKIETGKPAPLAAGTNLLGASYDDAGALLPQAQDKAQAFVNTFCGPEAVPAVCSGGLSAAAGMRSSALDVQMSQTEQYRQLALSQQAPNMQHEPDLQQASMQAQGVQQAMMQALGALAVLSKCSLSVMGESLIGIGTFVDPVAEPVVVAASKPVNRALARAMGCGSRQAIGFMVR